MGRSAAVSIDIPCHDHRGRAPADHGEGGAPVAGFLGAALSFPTVLFSFLLRGGRRLLAAGADRGAGPRRRPGRRRGAGWRPGRPRPRRRARHRRASPCSSRWPGSSAWPAPRCSTGSASASPPGSPCRSACCWRPRALRLAGDPAGRRAAEPPLPTGRTSSRQAFVGSLCVIRTGAGHRRLRAGRGDRGRRLLRGRPGPPARRRAAARRQLRADLRLRRRGRVLLGDARRARLRP